MSSPWEQMRRRGAALILGAAALGAAALGAAATTHALASTPAGATSAARVVPACRATQLTAWQAIPADGAAGSFYFELEFSNVSRTTCSLFGFPGVAALDSQNRILGRPATREGGPGHAVALAPGATAHAVLRLVDVGVFPTRMCRPTTAAAPADLPAEHVTGVDHPRVAAVCSSRAVRLLGEPGPRRRRHSRVQPVVLTQQGLARSSQGVRL